MDPDLIYDVGVNDGDDSAYYLSRGYRVVGVEADPLIAEKLRGRFAAEIRSGQFVLLNVGVGDQEGEADFWVSERTLWSSFNKDMASRDGLRCHAIKVRMVPLVDLFREHGVPLYCKIDVEGYDRICVRTLTKRCAPKYLSMEFDTATAEEDFSMLAQLGYSKFKIISQVTRTQPSPALMSLACAVPYRFATFLRQSQRNLLGPDANGSTFSADSSGPFGEDTPGGWRTYASAVELSQFLRSIERRRESKGLHEWFDIHARRDDAEATEMAFEPETTSARRSPEPVGGPAA